MTDVLLGLGVWVGASIVAVLMFMLGAGLGYRAGWEAGHLEGQRAADQRPRRSAAPPRAS